MGESKEYRVVWRIREKKGRGRGTVVDQFFRTLPEAKVFASVVRRDYPNPAYEGVGYEIQERTVTVSRWRPVREEP
jgi:hypothetical protein